MLEPLTGLLCLGQIALERGQGNKALVRRSNKEAQPCVASSRPKVGCSRLTSHMDTNQLSVLERYSYLGLATEIRPCREL